MAAPAQAADRVIAGAPPGLLSEVHAHGGNVVWGVARGYDEPETTSDYFVRDAGGTRRLPLDPYLRMLDLGARRGGGTQAVFSRCRARQSCVLGTYDFRSSKTRILPSLSRPRSSVQGPSTWNGRLAFARVPKVGASGPSGSLFATSPLRAVARVAPVATDLRGSRLAYVTSTGSRPYTTTLYVATLPRSGGRVRSCFVARATDTQTDSTDLYLSNPVLTASHVLWLRKDEKGVGSTDRRASIRRRRLPGPNCRLPGREERSRDIGGMSSFAVDRGRFFYTADTDNGPEELREATDPPFTFTR